VVSVAGLLINIVGVHALLLDSDHHLIMVVTVMMMMMNDGDGDVDHGDGVDDE